MYETLAIVNPSGRRRRKSSKRASPAQRRARAAFAAMARGRAHNPKRRRRSARRSNPLPFMHKARRRTHHRARARARRRNPISLRSMSSKPSFGLLSGAFTGAVGAIAINSALSRLPMPAMLMTGNVAFLTRGAAAFALGMIAHKLGFKGQTAARLTEGALTVTMVDLIKSLAAGAGIALGEVGYYLPGIQARPPSASGNPAMLAGAGRYITGPGSNVMPINRGMAGLAWGQSRPGGGFNR